MECGHWGSNPMPFSWKTNNVNLTTRLKKLNGTGFDPRCPQSIYSGAARHLTQRCLHVDFRHWESNPVLSGWASNTLTTMPFLPLNIHIYRIPLYMLSRRIWLGRAPSAAGLQADQNYGAVFSLGSPLCTHIITALAFRNVR